MLRAEGFDPLRESSLESRFAISNGFLGIRGGGPTSHGTSPSRTYVAGLFDSPTLAGAVPALAPAADWLCFHLSTAKGSPTHGRAPASGHHVTLDMRRGLLLSDCRDLVGPGLAVRLQALRLVSLANRALGLQVIQLDILQGETQVTVDASIDSSKLTLIAERIEHDLAVWRTETSGKTLIMAGAATLRVDGDVLAPVLSDPMRCCWTWRASPGQRVEFSRLVAVSRRDDAGPETGEATRDLVRQSQGRGWRALVEDHEAAWAERWRDSDIQIEGDPAAQQALRFAAYHLNSAANPADDRVSIGARALTGDDYRGHVFWDTEIFLLPFYCLTWPEAARALLAYRYRTLAGARENARRKGYQGALFAWESADTGLEATPRQVIGPDRQVINILTGDQEQHISADVAFAVWQYWLATEDADFLQTAGAEILLETARFWASRAVAEADGLHHIRGVIGPDEYHPTVDDNAFTNGMARWNIERALEVAELVSRLWPERWALLAFSLALEPSELAQWRSIADTLASGLDAATGLYEQFQGYFALEPVDLAAYAGRSVPMDVVLGRDRISRTQVIKQADVVALLALLPDNFPGQSGADNFNFYQPRCGHGSSLSRAMHGLAAARLGLSEPALGYFHQTAAIDLADTHAASAGGLHIAALGGLWQLAVFGFGGVALQDQALAVNPRLPPGWRSLRFRLQWRGRKLAFAIHADGCRLEIVLLAGASTDIMVNGHPHKTSLQTPLATVFAPAPAQVAEPAPGHPGIPT